MQALCAAEIYSSTTGPGGGAAPSQVAGRMQKLPQNKKVRTIVSDWEVGYAVAEPTEGHLPHA